MIRSRCAKPLGPSNDDLKRQHLAQARMLLDAREFDRAIGELDAALLAVPNDPEVVDLRAKTGEMKAAAGSSTSSEPIAVPGIRMATPAKPLHKSQTGLNRPSNHWAQTSKPISRRRVASVLRLNA